jgi:uncharacterized membrane protein YbhN (UPF0104 family)
MDDGGRRRRVLRRVFLVVVLGTTLLAVTGVVVARAVTGGPILESLQTIDLKWLAAATLCVVLGTASHGPRMRPLMPPPGPGGQVPGVATLGSLYVAASVLNLSFPGPAGEIAAALVLGRTHKLRPTAVLAASLHARFVALLVAAVITLVALPFLTIPPEVRPIAWVGAGALGAGGLVLGLLSFRPARFRALSETINGGLSRALPSPLSRFFAALHRQVLQFSEALVAVPRQGPGAYISAAVWSFGSLCLSFTAIMSAAAAFGLSPGWLGTFVTLCLTLIAAIALVVLPGGLGTFDLTLVGMLVASAGLTAAEAGLVLLGVRCAQILGVAVATIAFLSWAGQLLRADVVARVEGGGLEE